jgi:hypothetical protein
MKKLTLIIAVLSLFFVMTQPVLSAEATATAVAITAATCDNVCTECATIKVVVNAVPGKAFRHGWIEYSFPAGFPSWAEETNNKTYSDPLLVLVDKLENIEVERMWSNGMQKTPVVFYTEGGCVKFRQEFWAMPGNDIQVLATTWAGLKYELAIDKPGSVINRIYCLSGLIKLVQRADRSWTFRVQ